MRYFDERHELIFTSKRIIKNRNGEYPVSELTLTIHRYDDLNDLLDQIKGFLQADGFNFIQDINFTSYKYNDENEFKNDECSEDCCGSCDERNEIHINEKQEEKEDVSIR